MGQSYNRFCLSLFYFHTHEHNPIQIAGLPFGYISLKLVFRFDEYSTIGIAKSGDQVW